MRNLAKTATLLEDAHPAPWIRSRSLVESVDFQRLDASSALDPRRRVEMGQFMTPPGVARLMASMFQRRRGSIQLLDAGAGIGSLSAAWIDELCARKERPDAVTIVAYEIDPGLALRLRATMDVCRAHCEAAGIAFASEIRREDFIIAGVNADRALLVDPVVESFDCAILNPPYRKILAGSKTHGLLKSAHLDTSNLYTAFLSIVVRML